MNIDIKLTYRTIHNRKVKDYRTIDIKDLETPLQTILNNFTEIREFDNLYGMLKSIFDISPANLNSVITIDTDMYAEDIKISYCTPFLNSTDNPDSAFYLTVLIIANFVTMSNLLAVQSHTNKIEKEGEEQ